MKTQPKVASIEALRGFAIILVVVGHVIGSAPDGGMKIDFPSPWRYIYVWIDYIQMPLFTAIAGWVYALKPAEKNRFNTFAYKKMIRLLVPMATVGTLYFLIQYLIPGTNKKGDLSEIWRIYLFPYTIYWYLPSLFLIFLMTFWADKYKLCQTAVKCCYCFIAAWGVKSIVEVPVLQSIPNLFSFKGAFALLPYFLVGVGIQRFAKQIYNRSLNRIYIAFAVIGLLLLHYKWWYQLTYATPIAWYAIILPLWVSATILLLFHQNRSNRFFVWLGSYAYIIYLFHGFGTAGGRIILTRLGIHSEILLLFITTGIALFVPILVGKIVNRWRITQFLFAGKV